jgi:hypothetical protein
VFATCSLYFDELLVEECTAFGSSLFGDYSDEEIGSIFCILLTSQLGFGIVLCD